MAQSENERELSLARKNEADVRRVIMILGKLFNPGSLRHALQESRIREWPHWKGVAELAANRLLVLAEHDTKAAADRVKYDKGLLRAEDTREGK